MQLSDNDRLVLKKPTVDEAQDMLRNLQPGDLELQTQAELVLTEAGWPIENIRSLIPADVLALIQQTISQ